MLANLLRSRTAFTLAARHVNVAPRLPTSSVFRSLARPLSQSAPIQERHQNYRDGGYSSEREPRSDYGRDRGDRERRPRQERSPAPPSNTLYIANFPYRTTDSDVRDVFSRFGTIMGVKMGVNPDGTSRGFAHVEYLNKEDAISAFENHAAEAIWIDDRLIRLDYATPPVNRSPQPNTRLYYSQFSGHEEALRSVLNKYQNDIEEIFPLRGKDGSGFIAFKTQPAATEALEAFNGAQLEDGTVLNLAYARPPRNRQDDRPARNYRNQNYGS
ncbi:RNA-binding domain-containing protein [Pluteus cervinus]|uniref:RNA-binding domain-containing protein n=1 Tax=Pluteus cervinus TaxID=181527 RepID=A0ACD3AU47_9AGAR|nr:RNA-binding domain-containing protein [Pluteus cervinus]